MGTEKGFTLIELIVTIAIIGILGAIAVLNTPQIIDNYRVRGAARELYLDMNMARLSAIKGSRQWAICFSPGNTAFTSYSVRNNAGADGNLCTADDPVTVTAPFYRKDVDLSTGNYSSLTFAENFSGTNLEFNPNGTASSGNVTIAKGAKSVSIIVNQNTGNIRIQ